MAMHAAVVHTLDTIFGSFGFDVVCNVSFTSRFPVSSVSRKESFATQRKENESMMRREMEKNAVERLIRRRGNFTWG